MKTHTPQPPVITFYPGPDPDAESSATGELPVPRATARGSDHNMRPASGSSLLGGRYDLRRRIGSGGMAEVYLGWDLLLEREVAVKLLREEFVRDARQVARFRREAQLLARVDSDHVIQIYDMHFGRDACYLVLRHVVGRTLDRLVASSGALGAPMALQIACDVLEGLAHLHAEGLVHRDVKPSNVLVGNDERAVLLDLGVACDLRRPGITPVNFTAGTRAYMAPEQRETGKVDERSDVYQTGLLLLFAATGIDAATLPIDKGVRDALMALPARLAAVIDRAIDPDADRRFPSAAEMRAAALAAMQDQGAVELQVAAEDVVEAKPDPQTRSEAKLPTLLAEKIDEQIAAAQPEAPVSKIDVRPAEILTPLSDESDTAHETIAAAAEAAARKAAAKKDEVVLLERLAMQRLVLAEPTQQVRAPRRNTALRAVLLGAAGAICAVGLSTRLGERNTPEDVPTLALAPTAQPLAQPAELRLTIEPIESTGAQQVPPATAPGVPQHTGASTAEGARVAARVAPKARGADRYFRTGIQDERNGAFDSAIAAYRQYLRLEPEGANAPYVRIRVAELESAVHE